ncbi:MAG: Unknown protein [uncultured Sulfurovum sp.]|uniref:Sulfatase-modifying factor enzyme-like domain-containing protein n=1 Tax=uncultured Sulfurovum sp. TaxID=269237 RepID=A0A6S6TVI6_9BACT|nr:MAG: Unknown protein [uncultured Sulfurovum sp.]
MKQELEELISYLHRLDHVNMDKMDDAQLADILWLATHIPEVQKARQKKSNSEFLKWLRKWFSSLFSSNIKYKDKNEENKNKNTIDQDDLIVEESTPLIPKRLKDSNQFSVQIPQKRDFFINNELLKALEPLKISHVSSQESLEVDVDETVDSFAQTNVLKPKFQAKVENYYDLYLMIDISESMYIWQESIEVFMKKLEIFSIFKTIKFLYLDSSENEAQIYNNKHKTSKASKLLNHEGRSILFIITDCIAPAWSRGDMMAKLYGYQKRMPTSIINMLPRRMWKGTVLRQTNITRLKREGQVISSDIDELLLSFDQNYFKQDVLKVPIANFSIDNFRAMASFMSGRVDSSCRGIIASIEEFSNQQEKELTEELTADERVQEFFNHSSSSAHKLALYLSVCTHLNFPIMKMIQHNMLPDSTQLDFAEFSVGGLLDKSKKDEFYTFHTGVRELLQEKLSPYKSAEIFERNSRFIAKNLGSSLEFSALLMDESSNDEWTNKDKIFAEMSFSVLERLGGNYQQRVERIRRNRFGNSHKKKDLPKEVIHEIVFNSDSEDKDTIHPKTNTYQMGSNTGDDDEKPVHQITFDYDFAIAKTPVTFEEYDLYCEDTKTKKPDDEGWGRGQRPVINVSWNDAEGYCKWLSKKTKKEYRLPTEAEWEYACRAGTTTKWSFGDDEKALDNYAWYTKNSNSKTHPVGKKLPNPWGLYDMYGNVWEWCQDDWLNNYNDTPRDGTAYEDESTDSKVVRGGSWVVIAFFTRSVYRIDGDPSYRYFSGGFRLLRTLP